LTRRRSVVRNPFEQMVSSNDVSSRHSSAVSVGNSDGAALSLGHEAQDTAMTAASSTTGTNISHIAVPKTSSTGAVHGSHASSLDKAIHAAYTTVATSNAMLHAVPPAPPPTRHHSSSHGNSNHSSSHGGSVNASNTATSNSSGDAQHHSSSHPHTTLAVPDSLSSVTDGPQSKQSQP
jgi:hypothetical protein